MKAPGFIARAGDFFLDEFALRYWQLGFGKCPAPSSSNSFETDPGCRQFNDRDPEYSGTRIYHAEDDFIQQVHKQFQDQGGKLAEGYAPFCKHVFIKNFTGAKLGALTITASNRHLLQSGFSSRRPQELAVLSRWVASVCLLPS